MNYKTFAADALRSLGSRVVALSHSLRPASVTLAGAPRPKSLVIKDMAITTGADWTPDRIRAAEKMADAGNLTLAAQLCDAMLGDDRIQGCLIDVRIRGLLGCELKLEASSGRMNQPALKALELIEDWWVAFPEHAVAEWMAWGILLGISPATLEWEDVDRDGAWRMVPRLRTLHPHALKYDSDEDAWKYTPQEGDEITLTPGDGRCTLFTPYGPKRPWSRAPWRALSRFWLLKQYAIQDWGHHGEAARGLYVGLAPEGTKKEYREDLARELSEMGADSAIALPPGFDIKLIQADAGTWGTYQAQIQVANAAFAIRILGQNLSTEVAGSGSYAAAKVHEAVKQQIVRADDEMLATTLHDQVLTHYAKYNFGDATLAPWPYHDITPPADTTEIVETQVRAAEAARLWLELGVPVDVTEAAKAVDVKIDADAMPQEDVIKGDLAQFYLDYGIFTINEIRASRGLPPIPNGDVPPKPISEPPSPMGFARLASGDRPAAAPGMVRGQAYVDKLVAYARDAGARALCGEIDKILSIIEHVEDGAGWHERLRDALKEHFAALTAEEFEELTEKALILAELAGRTASQEDER